MDIHLIWAQDKNGSIGINGDLPWHIPQDLKNLKKITLNQVIVMGRKTWDSLKLKPLPKRRNIVLTSQHKIQDVDVFNNVNELLKSLIDSKEKQIFIIGGAQIYKEFWDLATTLHITIINENCTDADTFFPIKFNEIENDFKLSHSENLTKIAQYQCWERI